MYSIHSIPITNNNQKSFSAFQKKLTQKVEFTCFLPQYAYTYYDMVGRQLLKTKVALTNHTYGFKNMHSQLLAIDAYCFSNLICSVLVSDQDCKCRNCENQEKKKFFMLHCVALRGTNRYFYSIVDYICFDCAQEICSLEIKNALQRNDNANSERWKESLSALQKNTDNKKQISTVELYKLLLLSSNALGFQICQLEPFVDMFVQENFAAEQISILLAQDCDKKSTIFGENIIKNNKNQNNNKNDNNSKNICNSENNNARKPVTDLFQLSFVDSFLTCSCCNAKLEANHVEFGIMSTVCFDSSRVFAIPYFTCANAQCIKRWQSDDYKKERFKKLSFLYHNFMRECFRQSLQSLYYVPCKILGIEHAECLQQKRDLPCEQSLLLKTSVEQDMLNKLFNLDKQKIYANIALQSLQHIAENPCVTKLDRCVKRCLCENCISHNLLFIKLLEQFEIVLCDDNTASCAALDQVYLEFCNLQKEIPHNFVQKTRYRCWQNSDTPVCSKIQNSHNQFYNWRLKSKKRESKKTYKDCANCYVEEILDHNQMQEFFNSTCTFLSQMF